MPGKVKRTYNLAPETVRRVRELTEDDAVAPSQDAVVELAVEELDRRLREAREAEAWATAAHDPEVQAELDRIARQYRSADAETWPR